MVLLTVYLKCLRRPHAWSISANSASEQTVQIVKMRNKTTSVEILSPPTHHLIYNCRLRCYCFGFSLCHLSFAFKGVHTHHHPAPFFPIYPQLPLYLGPSLFLWGKQPPLHFPLSQTSCLARFQLPTLDIIFSSSFPVSWAAVIKAK